MDLKRHHCRKVRPANGEGEEEHDEEEPCLLLCPTGSKGRRQSSSSSFASRGEGGESLSSSIPQERKVGEAYPTWFCPYGHVSMRPHILVALVAMCPSGHVFKWPCDSLATWPCGRSATWPYREHHTRPHTPNGHGAGRRDSPPPNI